MRAGSKEGGGGDRGRVAGSAPVAARRPPSLCMSRSLWRSAAEDSASGSTRCLGLTRPLAEWVSSSVARAVAAAVEAAGAARLPLPSAHSARPGSSSSLQSPPLLRVLPLLRPPPQLRVRTPSVVSAQHTCIITLRPGDW